VMIAAFNAPALYTHVAHCPNQLASSNRIADCDMAASELRPKKGN
jgi:hypothetical protein